MVCNATSRRPIKAILPWIRAGEHTIGGHSSSHMQGWRWHCKHCGLRPLSVLSVIHLVLLVSLTRASRKRGVQ